MLAQVNEVLATDPFRAAARCAPSPLPARRGIEAMMEYKGYVAAVEFDDSVGRLHGRVVNSGAYPIATFEATDVDGIRREFQRSIDEYLASCREDGVEPKKPFSGNLNLRLGPDLHQRAALSATAHDVSLNGWIKQAVEEKASR